jgi:hypothetical protein
MATRPRRTSAWRRCDEAIARIAPTCTTTCQVCDDKINEGEWQLGLMYLHDDGFMLMEWHHLGCTASLPGQGLYELELVQNEMTPLQKREFLLILQKANPFAMCANTSNHPEESQHLTVASQVA